MKLVTFRAGTEHDRVGVLLGEDRVLDLTAAGDPAARMFTSMIDLIEAGDEAINMVRSLSKAAKASACLDLAKVQLRAPIPLPPRMRAMSCDPLHLKQAHSGRARLMGVDAGHSEEQIRKTLDELPRTPLPGWYETPVYWFMDRHCVSNPDDVVTWPAYSKWIDYELELGAVVGKAGRNLTKNTAAAYIFGYTIVNDLSARDAQFRASSTGLSITAKGKDFDGSYPMGPCIVTADEFDAAHATAVLRVNGEEWGRGSTVNRHWSLEDGLVYASQDAMLLPGEILTSATIANCAGMEKARRGDFGDVVELEVEGIGVLRTRIAQRRKPARDPSSPEPKP